MYKAPKEQVIVFGFRTQFGGGKSTGFALVYDSKEALKFEPRYRLVRVRRMVVQYDFSLRLTCESLAVRPCGPHQEASAKTTKGAKEQVQEVPWYRKGQGCVGIASNSQSTFANILCFAGAEPAKKGK